jgi:hypothetical protein
MRGEITLIHPIKFGRNKEPFIRVEFKMEDGSWAKTDLCLNYRNFEHWKWLLKVGRQLKDLEYTEKNGAPVKGEINADCFPDIFQAKRSGHWEQLANGNMAWIEDSIQIRPIKKSGVIQPKLLFT